MFMALKNAVDFVNAFRMISGADNFNGGRDAIKAENSNVNPSPNLQIFIISDFLDAEFIQMSWLMINKKTMLRWD